MDIVGSILKKMTAPPALDENERKLRQKRVEAEKKMRADEQGRIQAFVQSVTRRIKAFDENEEAQGPRLIFNPMPKPQRAIIHGIAEAEQLVAASFGMDEVDRHVIVFRQHTVPSEPELVAMRRNEPYVPESDMAEEDTASSEQEEEKRETAAESRHRRTVQPEYLQKYQKVLGGLAVAKDAAKTTVTKRSYGFVSSEQKSDKRTIEETLADIRARKKLRQDAAAEADGTQDT